MPKSSFFKVVTLLLPILASPKWQNHKGKTTEVQNTASNMQQENEAWSQGFQDVDGIALHSQLSSNRKNGQRDRREKTEQADMEKTQTQDSSLLLVYRVNISFVSLGKANMNDIL